jgi:tetratricopeptide (TPR) repeat protein
LQEEKGLLLAAALLAVLVLAVHARALGNGFVSLDDEPYVTANPEVRAGLSWQGIRWAFTTTHEANWHPVTWISHMADVELFGLKPAGHHLTNILIHAANAVLVLLLFARMTGRVWSSATVAALFAMHPFRVESVAWVAERKDVLCALFGLLAMLAYVRAIRAGRRGSSPAAVALFAMSLLSKPMLVTLPFLLLLLDFWPLGRMKAPDGSLSREPALWRRLVFEKAPFFLLSMGSAIVTLWAQKGGGAMADNALNFTARLGNAFYSYLAYLTKTFTPFSLSVLYPHPGKAGWMAVFAAAILVAISLSAIHWARRCPSVAVGWFWFLGALVPVIGLVQVGWQARADRYTYLPSIGLAVVLVWGLGDLGRLLNTGPRLLVAAAVAAVGLLSFLTWREIGYWKDSETLYARGLATTEKNHILHINLGIERVRHGYVSEGLDHFRQAVAIQPGYWYGQLTLGAALAGMERPAEAIPYLETALRLHPDSAEGRTALGGALAAQGRLPEAVSQLKQAIALDPGSVRAHHAMARTLELRGQAKEALEEYRRAVRLDPSHVDAQERLSQGLLAEGRLTEALAQLDEALRYLPDSERLHVTRARALVAAGRRAQGRDDLRAALRLSPGFSPAATLLVAMLATSSDTSPSEGEEALELARKLAEQNGGRDPNMLDLLAAAEAQVGRYTEAVQTAELAIRLADAAGQKKISQVIAGRLAFYKAGRPYRAPTQ